VSIGGIVFLALYYLSHPPFIGADYMMPTEGSYLWIDKNIIEIVALMVLIYFPTSRVIGIDRYISKVFNRKSA
ncbi:MAG: DoxX subfamily, partial [Prevotella sp.]|nr:DoxX subfamily [Prevotella sp.]